MVCAMEIPTTRTWFVAALAGAALSAGCGGGGETKTVTAPAEDAAAQASSPAPSPEPQGQAPEGGVVSAEGTIDDGLAKLTVTELRRSGPTVLLNATLEPAGSDTEASRQIGSTLSDGEFGDLADGGSQSGYTFDGPYLVDPEGRKKYLVALDATGNCVCSNDLSGAFADSGPVKLTATLSAPPPTVKRVDLTIPRFGTFRGVPITE